MSTMRKSRILRITGICYGVVPLFIGLDAVGGRLILPDTGGQRVPDQREHEQGSTCARVV
jgi:hypothetical protein